MYEHKSRPLAPPHVYYRRLFTNLLIAFIVILVSLFIGIVGYHFFAHLNWLDSLYNASMILSGMGPADTIGSASGKWFSSIYALFSGVIFITNIGVIIAPVVHRFFHKFHLEEK
jgi:hypothetical protein